MRNNPKIWNKLLSEITPIIGPCLIAGGCVRDFVVCGEERPPSDIDIFIPAKESLSVEFALADLQDLAALPPPRTFIDFILLTNGGSYPPDDNVSAVLEGWWRNGRDEYGSPSETRINVIGRRTENFLSDPSLLMSEFDHSLCQFWYTPEGGVQMTDAAKKTLDTKMITRYTDDTRTKSRIEGLVARAGYTEFTYEGQRRPRKKDVLSGSDYMKIKEFVQMYGQALR